MADVSSLPPKRGRGSRKEELCAFCHEGEDSDDPDDDPIVRTNAVVRRKPVWAHVECLAWCPDLYQSEDLVWQNVGKALNRCHRLKCAVCGEGDAPLGCRRAACKKNWHYPCAMEPKTGLVIYEDEFCVACPVCHEVLEARRRKKERIAAELAAAKAMKAGTKKQAQLSAKAKPTTKLESVPAKSAKPVGTPGAPLESAAARSVKPNGLTGLASAIAATPGASLLSKEGPVARKGATSSTEVKHKSDARGASSRMTVG